MFSIDDSTEDGVYFEICSTPGIQNIRKFVNFPAFLRSIYICHLKTMNSVFKMMNFAIKTMDCLFKMMIFLCKFPGGVAMSGPIPERVNGNIVQNVLKIAI